MSNARTSRTWGSAGWFFVVAICQSLILGGCASYQRVAAAGEGGFQEQVQIGNTVKVVRINGTTENFIVSGLDETGIAGDGIFIKLDDIQSLEVRTSSRWREAGLVAGALLLVGAIAFFVTVLDLETD